jgi:hypothetical protein
MLGLAGDAKDYLVFLRLGSSATADIRSERLPASLERSSARGFFGTDWCSLPRCRLVSRQLRVL